MTRITLLAATTFAVVAAQATSALAACGVLINGQPMSPQLCATAAQIYGSVIPGSYWMDAQGTWGHMGDPTPRGNQYLDAQRLSTGGQSGGGGYIYRGPSGNMGSDGSCSYYNDPSTGASVMTGNC